MRTLLIVLVTALCTAALTSAFWISRERNARLSAPGPDSAVEAPTLRPPAIIAPPRDLAPRTATAPSAATARVGAIPQDLRAKGLSIPVLGITAEQLTPQFYDARGERGHEALDIVVPRGEPVVAVEDGTIAKLFTSVAGGLTIYEFDPTQTYVYYYAHLDRYADGLKEGDSVKRGQTIGYVGMTGNAGSPHLHFAIFLLSPEKKWWKGEALDPYPVLTAR
jgi:murein DD-endopeptidase MepM/ murein hydrolase activator NlpD